jgi:hypothetical protein
MGSGLSLQHDKSSSHQSHKSHKHQSHHSNSSNDEAVVIASYDVHMMQMVRCIFRNEGAKRAFINFIRHEDNIEHGKEQNYYKRGNFAIIESNEERVSEVLSRHSGEVDEDIDTKDEYTYESLKPFFDQMDVRTQRQILNYKGGSAHEMLLKFQKVPDEIMLLMIIEALPRFEASDSFQRWWKREHEVEFSISNLFSFHRSSRRTTSLAATTGKHIEPIWSSKNDIFAAIQHCLNSLPVASAILLSRSNEAHHGKSYPMIYVSDSYAKIFGSSSAEMLHQPFNLLSCGDSIANPLNDHLTTKITISFQSNHCGTSRVPNDDASIDITRSPTPLTLAVGMKPVHDQKSEYLYVFVIVADLMSQSFCVESLKLTMDLLDILPSLLPLTASPSPPPQHFSPFHPFSTHLNHESHHR